MTAEAALGSAGLYLVFRRRQLLVQHAAGAGADRENEGARGAVRFLEAEESLRLALEPERWLPVGEHRGIPCFAAELEEAEEPPEAALAEGARFEGLRSLVALLDASLWRLVGRGIQLVEWDRDHRFCGRCGAVTEPQAGERVRTCPRCGLQHFPRVAPAVIVLIRRGEEILLARSPYFLPGVYSTLAGFVEPGESLEEAVCREVEEEVGVQVRDLAYFGSQPWPFPHSLMVGFTAEHAGGEIRPQPGEIEDAGWFHPDALPGLPFRQSIARALIEDFLAARRAASRAGKGAP